MMEIFKFQQIWTNDCQCYMFYQTLYIDVCLSIFSDGNEWKNSLLEYNNAMGILIKVVWATLMG